MNITAILISSLIPMLVGFVWYHPKVLGTAWMNITGITDEKIKSSNMLLILGITLLFSVMMSMAMTSMVIHQIHLGSLFADIAGDKKIEVMLNGQVTDVTNKFRTFKHGSFHGIIGAIFFALPILGINALFERRGAKYIFLHLGYWVITMALMGGVICGLK